MARNNRYPFWTQDTVAAAVLAGVATASAQSKLEAWALDANNAAFTALVHYWPVLMILAGLVLLLLHPVTPERLSDRAPGSSNETEISHDASLQ